MRRTLGWQRSDVPRDFHLLFLPTRQWLRRSVSAVLKTRDMSSHPELLPPEGLTTVSWLNMCIISESDATRNLSSGIEEAATWVLSGQTEYITDGALCFVCPSILVKVLLAYLTFVCALCNFLHLKHFVFRLNPSANRLYLLLNELKRWVSQQWTTTAFK